VTAIAPYVHRYGIVGRSAAIGEVIRRIELVSTTRSTVLITGETGTGKELVARAVHVASAQRGLPFVRVNCAAIPDTLLESELFGHVRGAFTGATETRRGRFALANRGSIFLDEIGTLSIAVQAKLLRVLQEREIEPVGAERTEHVDVRVIAATNADLRRLVGDDRFREDLYYRLHVVPIAVPPLRQRAEDIPLLVEYLIAKHVARTGRDVDGVDEDVLSSFQAYDWPGNVRELENAIERAIVLTKTRRISKDAIFLEPTPSTSAAVVPSLKLHRNVEWIERETIRQALELTTAKNQAARLMGITPRALSYYLTKYPSLDQGNETGSFSG
jgi:transcriptional regulator with GAF, ATPase, and Fis domain